MATANITEDVTHIARWQAIARAILETESLDDDMEESLQKLASFEPTGHAVDNDVHEDLITQLQNQYDVSVEY